MCEYSPLRLESTCFMKRIVNSFTKLGPRPLVVALLLQQFIFFNIILPGHTRGQITTDGKHTKDPAPIASCCCCCCGSHATAPDTKPDSKSPPSKRDREHCALCDFAARVLPTPSPCIILPELGLLDIVPPARPCTPIPADLIQSYQSRGPPISA